MFRIRKPTPRRRCKEKSPYHLRSKQHRPVPAVIPAARTPSPKPLDHPLSETSSPIPRLLFPDPSEPAPPQTSSPAPSASHAPRPAPPPKLRGSKAPALDDLLSEDDDEEEDLERAVRPDRIVLPGNDPLISQVLSLFPSDGS